MVVHDTKTMRRWKDAPDITGEMEPESIDTYLTDNFVHNVRIVKNDGLPQDKEDTDKCKLRSIDKERLDLLLMRKQHAFYELGIITSIEALKQLNVSEEDINAIIDTSSYEFDSIIAEYVKEGSANMEELMKDGI